MKFQIIYLLILLTIVISDNNININSTMSLDSRSDIDGFGTRILSRRKRYLTFPDGSSFQLVFCTQNHGYLQIGDVVWFGTTAALAWELPTDTQAFANFKEYYKFKDLRRSGIIYYTDEDGRVIDKKEYHRRPIVNPAFAKRSVTSEVEEYSKKNISIKKMHDFQKRISLFKDLDASRIDFHRSGRKVLYGKLEKLLQGLGWNGKECILKMLCEAGKMKNKQGEFLGEIVKAVFTLPKGREFDTEYTKQYDIAHGADGDCDILYPKCGL